MWQMWPVGLGWERGHRWEATKETHVSWLSRCGASCQETLISGIIYQQMETGIKKHSMLQCQRLIDGEHVCTSQYWLTPLCEEGRTRPGGRLVRTTLPQHLCVLHTWDYLIPTTAHDNTLSRSSLPTSFCHAVGVGEDGMTKATIILIFGVGAQGHLGYDLGCWLAGTGPSVNSTQTDRLAQLIGGKVAPLALSGPLIVVRSIQT